MAERSAYAPGVPSYVDLEVPDTEVAARFYGGLFSWERRVIPEPGAGGYGMFLLRGKVVAGVGPVMGEGALPHWTVYVDVADADQAVAKVESAGGKTLAGPMDIFDQGRMAIAQDPTGAVFGIWQARAFKGAQLVNEPGAFVWNELSSPDIAQATQFYISVFGWGTQKSQEGEGGVVFTVDGNVTCGAHPAGPGEPPAWTVWFSVEDCDASAGRATGMGAKAIMPPTDMGFGRGAVLADPQGAVFGIGALKSAS
jgi:predicted enzyme related to lactoylglutathione lyase